MCPIFFIHSSVNGHLGGFHVLAIVKSAAMNIAVHVFWFILPAVATGRQHSLCFTKLPRCRRTQNCLPLPNIHTFLIFISEQEGGQEKGNWEVDPRGTHKTWAVTIILPASRTLQIFHIFPLPWPTGSQANWEVNYPQYLHL